MPIRWLVINFQSTIIACAYVDTQIHLHMHIHSLSCRQTQAFNLPFVTRTYTRMHTHIHTTHPHIDKAFGDRAFGYGKAWYYILGQTFGNRHTLGHTGIHTLGHRIRVCEVGEGGGGTSHITYTCIANHMLCVCMPGPITLYPIIPTQSVGKSVVLGPCYITTHIHTQTHTHTYTHNNMHLCED